MPSSAASTIASSTFRRARHAMHATTFPCHPKNSGGGVLTTEGPVLIRKTGGPCGCPINVNSVVVAQQEDSYGDSRFHPVVSLHGRLRPLAGSACACARARRKRVSPLQH